MNNRLINIFLLVMLAASAPAQEIGLKGQLAAWVTAKPGDTFRYMLGSRYIPELSFGIPIKEKFKLDGEFSLNAYGYGYHNGDSMDWDGDINLFRAWVRFSSNKLNIRIGLQKINFGSAAMLRPLMWFDQIDPRDPLQLTNGVYGILGRYYFPNNANIWLWLLYGNDERKGWEVFPSYRDIPEYGGRVQLPFLGGEIAMNFHHRTVNLEGNLPPEYQVTEFHVPENRIGLDGKWDIGVGLWFETAFFHQNIEIAELRSKKLLNAGMDYTIGIGSGLMLMGEQFLISTSENMFDAGQSASFTAISANYPISIIDNLTYIFYYDWANNGYYNFLNWGMTWDKINLYIMAYWNPDDYNLYQSLNDQATLYTGKGFQVQFVFNH